MVLFHQNSEKNVLIEFLVISYKRYTYTTNHVNILHNLYKIEWILSGYKRRLEEDINNTPMGFLLDLGGLKIKRQKKGTPLFERQIKLFDRNFFNNREERNVGILLDWTADETESSIQGGGGSTVGDGIFTSGRPTKWADKAAFTVRPPQY